MIFHSFDDRKYCDSLLQCNVRERSSQAIDKVVAQVSKPAVSQGFQPADAAKSNTHSRLGRAADLEIGDTAGLETCATACQRDATAADRLCQWPWAPSGAQYSP